MKNDCESNLTILFAVKVYLPILINGIWVMLVLNITLLLYLVLKVPVKVGIFIDADVSKDSALLMITYQVLY